MASPAVLYQAGNHAGRPASGSGCVLYSCTDHDLVYRDDGTSWTTFMTLVGGSGGDIATDAIWDEAGDTAVGSGTNTAVRRKNNDGAATAPAVGDDSGDGYAIGSRWLDTTNDLEYVCTDASVGAAIWRLTTPGVPVTYVPTLTASTTNPTIGNGVLAGRYALIGTKLCWVEVSWNFGSTSNAGSGEYSFAAPFQAAARDHALAAWLIDAGTGYFAGVGHIYASGSVINPVVIADATGQRALTNTVPITWASASGGDKIVITGVYEIA